MAVRYGAVELDWLGRAAIRVEGRTGTVVYVDPGRSPLDGAEDPRDGDLVLVTHGHHYDPDGIRRVARDDAVVLVHESIDTAGVGDGPPPERLPHDVERVGDDEAFVLGPLDLWTTPAYNRRDGPRVRDDGRPCHAEGEGCGYGLTMDGVTVYVPGDTDALPFHDDLEVDVCCLPIDGRYTMDGREAAALAARMRPGLVVPIHYDATGDDAADARRFVLAVATSGVPVVLDA